MLEPTGRHSARSTPAMAPRTAPPPGPRWIAAREYAISTGAIHLGEAVPAGSSPGRRCGKPVECLTCRLQRTIGVAGAVSALCKQSFVVMLHRPPSLAQMPVGPRSSAVSREDRVSSLVSEHLERPARGQRTLATYSLGLN